MYLDHELSNSFNISTPPWHSDIEMSVGYNLGTSCLSPIDNSTVFIIGGRTWIATSTTTYYYSMHHLSKPSNSEFVHLNVFDWSSSENVASV
ncbi:hypothetical protein C2G38_2231786 [Gigaspora rosea]|uniref:Uncharacterized protein n=1 Tax=Gigaspora rosea TaxID=44941 RepID=A0A397U151_9GLOM|nr:hypothetical protein C2G38_2231786 [Gigaspora rosea]